MSWFLLSLTAALSLATADALTKRYFGHRAPFEMAVVRLTYTLPWLLAAAPFISWRVPDRTFWGCLAAGLPLEILALYCYMKAIKLSPLSLTLPFLAFTPIFILLTGRLLLGECVSGMGVVGIGLIVAGAYVLNFSRIAQGIWMPFRAILREPGSRLMLLVSLIYSLTATIGKLAIRHSSPYVFGEVYFTALCLLTLGLGALGGQARGRAARADLAPGLILGAVYALMIFSHMLAISMVQAAYMIALKRTSLIFGVLYGAWWFREERLRERLAGAAVMLLGVFVIGRFG